MSKCNKHTYNTDTSEVTSRTNCVSARSLKYVSVSIYYSAVWYSVVYYSVVSFNRGIGFVTQSLINLIGIIGSWVTSICCVFLICSVV